MPVGTNWKKLSRGPPEKKKKKVLLTVTKVKKLGAEVPPVLKMAKKLKRKNYSFKIILKVNTPARNAPLFLENNPWKKPKNQGFSPESREYKCLMKKKFFEKLGPF